MNERIRTALRVTLSTSLVVTSEIARADAPTPSALRVQDGQIVADWAATPPAAQAGCWKALKTGTYQLVNASVGCTGNLALTKVAVTVDAKGNVTELGGHAPSGAVHMLDASGAVTTGPFSLLATSGSESDALAKGILFADDKGVYLPRSFVRGGTKPRIEGGKFVADWAAKPEATCWTAIGTPDANGAGTYALKNASPACARALGATIVDVGIDGSGKLTFGGRPQEGKVYSLDADGAPLEEIGKLTDATFAEKQAKAGLLLADGAGVYVVHSVVPAASEPTPCIWPSVEGDDSPRVDVDLPRSSVVVVPRRNVIRPNEGLMVRVCHVHGEAFTVAWGGTRGLTAASTGVPGGPPTGETHAKSGEKGPEQPRPDVSVVHFAPRQPGSADVTVTQGKGDDEAKTITVELQVDTLYWGSIRFGLGTTFDVGDNARTYAVSTTAGSLQPEITESHSAVGFELVSGFAPYLLDVFSRAHGRSYTGGTNYFVAPFIGFGVIGGGTNQTGVQALSSFHAGVELELSQSFSIAVTFVERRGQGLDSRYHVGSPVSSGMTASDVTQDAWAPGLGVVICTSPSFLQFATGGSPPTNASTSSRPPTTGTGK